MTLAEAIAACSARKLGTSDCLEAIDASGACGDRLPTATAGVGGGVTFSCSSVPSSRKAAAELKEAQAVVAAHAGTSPWVFAAGAAGVALVLYLVVR